jgi:hypothetical protein
MVGFNPGGSTGTPFGRNEFLRSTNPKPQTESYTCSAATVPAQTIDGAPGQKILQPGTVMAKITSGSEAGKIGPYQAAGTNEVQTVTPSGTISGGTYTITAPGKGTTAALAYNANAAAVQAALEAIPGIGAGNVTVTGGPLSSGALVITFVGVAGGQDQAMLTIATGSLTGSTPGASVAQTTQGVAGATDGRQTSTNIVGLLVTFLPWQLIEGDAEVSVTYDCTAVQGWCLESNAAGTPVVLSNTTADAMRGTKGLDIKFK